jgi:hypothetical protein
LFFQNWEESSWNSIFFARDYASRDQIYHFIHLTLRLFSTPTVADVIDYLEYIANISENTVDENHYCNRRGRPREHPKGTSDHACALPYFSGKALRVTSFPVKRPH